MVNFRLPWSSGDDSKFTVSGVKYQCRYSTFRTFHNGPDWQDPGHVPNGASCGKGKVTIFDNQSKNRSINSIIDK